MLSVWSNYMDIRYEIIARLWHSKGSKLDLETPCYCLPISSMMLLASFFSTSSIVQVLTSFLTSEVLWSGSIKWSFLQFILTFAMRRKLLGNFRGHFQSWFTSLANFILFRKNSQLWFLKNKSWFIILELCSFGQKNLWHRM